MEDTISDENFIGTDEDGTSYYADEDGNISAVFSDGTVTTENANDDAPDPDDYDGVVETLNTDTSREYTFDDNGNLVDSDTGEQVDTSDWNDVIGVATEQDGKTTPVAGYTYTGTDKNGNSLYSNSNGRKFTEEELRERLTNPNIANYTDKDAKIAQNLANTYGPAAMNPDVLNAYKKNPEAVRNATAEAAEGNPAAQALVAAMTGTVPTNVTDNRVYEMLADMEDRIAKGEDIKSAYENAGNKVGLTSDMSSLTNIIGLIGPELIAGPLISAGVRGLTAGRIGTLLNQASKANKLSKTAQVASKANALGRRGTGITRDAINLMDKGSKVAGVVNLGTGLAGAGLGVAGAMGNSGTGPGSSSSVSPYKQPNQAAQSIINGRTRNEESGDDKLAAAEATKAPTPTTTKSDPVITFSNPFGREEPVDISIPKGPLEGTPLSGVGLPEPEDPKAGEERGFEKENSEKSEKSENSDSGDDTLETTTQDAPTGGVGTDTFVNTNDDTRKGWGLGEEDPNRANYDIDKWNRGMERVSTDVVSDAKVKNFITKTFKNDPVLMKTVKIMKSK